MVKLYPSRDFMSNGFSRTELRNQESLEVSKILRELCQNSYDAFSEVVGGGGDF